MVDITDEMNDLKECYEHRLKAQDVMLECRHRELIYFLEKYLKEFRDHEKTQEKLVRLNDKIENILKEQADEEDV